MKISSILSLGVLLLGSLAGAEEVWAYGVTRESGWYDYNKENKSDYYNDDSHLCWAASASNIIAWWQNHNKDKLTHLTLPPDPWDAFRIVYIDKGGYIDYGLNWYINGILDDAQQNLVYPNLYDASITYDEDGKDKEPDYRLGSFLNPWGAPAGTSVYSTQENPIQLYNLNGDGYMLSGKIIDALSNGYALGLSLFNDASNAEMAHALTLWGAEYTGSGDKRQLTKIWATDSDVQESTLQEFDIDFKESTVAIMGGYMGGSEIRRVDGMRTEMKLLPEPSSAALATLAFVCLVGRRRRQ